MAILEVLTFPNPILREVSVLVKNFDSKLKQLADDMIETMYHSKGIGLAAPQVGALSRVLVIDTRPRNDGGQRYKPEDMTELEKGFDQPLIIVNPVIVKGEGKTTFDEGCLSVPGYFETVERYLYIEVKAQDLKGREFLIKTDGLLAICLQHEMDHLEGTLFIDHLSFLKSQKIKTQIKKHGYPPKKDSKDDENEKDQDKKSNLSKPTDINKATKLNKTKEKLEI
jgi:peptide deformylase